MIKNLDIKSLLKKFWLPIILYMFVLLGALVVRNLPERDSPWRGVVSYELSPNGYYLAEIWFGNHGATGGSTRIVITRQSNRRNSGTTVYHGGWGEFYDMELNWITDDELHVYFRDEIMVFVSENGQWEPITLYDGVLEENEVTDYEVDEFFQLSNNRLERSSTDFFQTTDDIQLGIARRTNSDEFGDYFNLNSFDSYIKLDTDCQVHGTNAISTLECEREKTCVA